MGSVIDFFVVDQRWKPPEPETDYTWVDFWDVKNFTHLCGAIGKRDYLHTEIYDLDEFHETQFHYDGEPCIGQVSAGPLVRVIHQYCDLHPVVLWEDERAALAYLEAIPFNRQIVIYRI